MLAAGADDIRSANPLIRRRSCVDYFLYFSVFVSFFRFRSLGSAPAVGFVTANGSRKAAPVEYQRSGHHTGRLYSAIAVLLDIPYLYTSSLFFLVCTFRTKTEAIPNPSLYLCPANGGVEKKT